MRIIQMGMGGMGNHWINQLAQLDFIEYVGFVEVNEEIAKAQAAHHNIDPQIIFKRLPDALDRVQADGVIAVIPPQFRLETLRTCIDAGVGLMAEKPLSETMTDAAQQVELANSSRIVYMVTQDYRYKPVFQTIKQLLDSGSMGHVDAIHIEHWHGLEFTGFRNEMPFPLLNDMAIHHFDLTRFFLGSNPLQLYGQSWSPSWNKNKGKMSTTALMTFPNDVHVSYRSSWVSNGLISTYDGNWRFECEKGVVELRDNEITVQMRDALDDKNYTYHTAEKVPHVTMPYERQSYLAHEFYKAVIDGQTPVTTAADNFYSLQMVFDVIESCATGAIVTRGEI